MGKPLRYLALGDSYTIGTGASAAEHAWPSIVARRLGDKMRRPVELTNPAVNGYTTEDLIARELPYVRSLAPDLVTILIGVNDLVQGKHPNRYLDALAKIYDEVASSVLPAGHVAAISIPDWSFVPAAADFGGPAQVARLTRTFNEIAETEALGRGFAWIDLGPASRSSVGSPGWIASDGLHPGDAQYAAWADAIWNALGESFQPPVEAS